MCMNVIILLYFAFCLYLPFGFAGIFDHGMCVVCYYIYCTFYCMTALPEHSAIIAIDVCPWP